MCYIRTTMGRRNTPVVPVEAFVKDAALAEVIGHEEVLRVREAENVEKIRADMDSEAKRLKEDAEQLRSEVERVKQSLAKRESAALASLEDLFRKHDIDPHEELIKAVLGESDLLSLDADQKVAVLKELAAYARPKKKALETREEHDVNITVTIQRFGDRPAAPLEIPAEVVP